MPLFKSLPFIIEANQYREFSSAYTKGMCHCQLADYPHCHGTKEIHKVEDNDWIVIGIDGKPYPVDNTIFKVKYEPVEI